MRGIVRDGGEQVGLHYIVDKAEIAAGFAVAVDIHRFALDHAGDPLRDDGGIGAVRVLARAEDVEVAQAHALQPVGFAKDIGVELVHILGYGIRRQGFADDVFDLGQAGVVAVSAAARGVDKALDFGVSGGNEHVEEARDVGGVGGEGVGHAAGDAAQGGLVQDVVNGGATLTPALSQGERE